jgi:protein tyrosine phosphatase
MAHIERDQVFTVGDGKTYGGFFNAPLKRARSYRIWFGIVVTVDGASASLYEVIEVPGLGGEEEKVPSEAPNLASAADADASGMVIGIVVGIVVVMAVIGIVMAVVIYRRRQKQQRRSLPTDTNKTHDSHNNGKFSSTSAADAAADVDEDDDEGDDVSTYVAAEVTPLFAMSGSMAGAVSKGGGGGTMDRRLIPVENLWNYVAAKKLAVENSFTHEYSALPQGLLFPCEVARRHENRQCNRYGNIIAYDHSRVVLEFCGTYGSDYINASYIDGYKRPGAFVATQGPSKFTISDIWLMVWQLKSTRIVMLANLIEDGRRKCEQYWPESGTKCYNDVTVQLVDMEQFADFKIRTFNLSHAGGGSTRTVRHFHFTAWPDHGVPAQPTSLLAFRRKFHSYDSTEMSGGPVIIHCSAGVGRTGTFIAIDCLLDQARAEGAVDVFSCIRQMRQARVNMVQTQEQYVFVYDALLEALAAGDTSIPSTEFRERLADLRKVNPNTGKTRCLEEFEMLSSVSAQLSSIDPAKLDGLKEENIAKNRVTSIVPLSKFSRPYLLTCHAGSTDYINAVFIDGYKQREAFIVTQTPMTNTVVDFWTMIHDHTCRTIVMLNDLDTADQTVGKYFPLTGSQNFGPFTISLVAVDDKTNPDIVIRDFTLTYKQRASSDPVTVRHFQFAAWPSHDVVPTSQSALLSLLGLLETWQQRSGNGPIVVHCLDGASRCGLICALSYMVERLKVEQDIDVFQSVKHARINRPQLVPTFDQYQFLYSMAVEYLNCFETYANFK